MNHMAWLQLVTWLLVALTGICYLYQVVYLIIPFFVKPRPHQSARLHRYAILIAARNEEAVLPHLLDSIAAQDYPAELLTTFVVADNCTDRTAQVAQRPGIRPEQPDPGGKRLRPAFSPGQAPADGRLGPVRRIF